MQKSEENVDCLGYIVLYGNISQVNLTAGDIAVELSNQELDDYKLPDPSGVVALTRSAKELERSHENKFFRPLINNAQKKSVAIVREDRNLIEEEIDFEHETTGTYDKTHGTFSAEGPDAEEFEELFDKYANILIGEDVRQMSRTIVDSTNVISLRGGEYVRDAGGIYFVPPQEIDRIRSLKLVLENLEIGYVKIFRVMDGPGERTDLFSSALIYFHKQLEQISERVDNIAVRISSLRDCDKQLNDIQARLKAYALLTGKIEDESIRLFDMEIQKCKTKINEKIAKIESERKAKKKKSY
jgi:hypothetical protein